MVARTEDSEVEKGPVVHFSCCFPSAEIVYFRKGKECSWAALYERRALRGPTWHHCCSSCREGICKPHLQQPALQTPPQAVCLQTPPPCTTHEKEYSRSPTLHPWEPSCGPQILPLGLRGMRYSVGLEVTARPNPARGFHWCCNYWSIRYFRL